MSIVEFHEFIKSLRDEYKRNVGRKRTTMGLLYLNTVLIMLYNGLRVNEARLCLQKWYRTNKRAVVIPALKTHRRSFRRCVIPDEIEDWELYLMAKFLPLDDPERFRKRAHWFMKYNLGINPHMLRKIFIDMMLDAGYSPAKVARILGLMKIRTLEYYAFERYVDKIRKAHRRREKLEESF